MISATSLSTYLFCPRKLYLQKVLKWFDPPNKAMVKGTIRHSVIEAVTYKEEAIVTNITLEHDFDAIHTMYLRTFKAALRDVIMKSKNRCRSVQLPLLEAYNHTLPYLERMAEDQAQRVHSLMRSNNLAGVHLWEALVPKIKPEIKIRSKTLGLSGIVDQLHVYPNKLLPVELKTGKTPQGAPWPGHKVQVGAYLLLLAEAYETEIDVGTVHYLDSGQKFDVVMNPFFKQEIMEMRDAINQLLEAKEAPSIVQNTNKCEPCSFKERCHAYKN